MKASVKILESLSFLRHVAVVKAAFLSVMLINFWTGLSLLYCASVAFDFFLSSGIFSCLWLLLLLFSYILNCIPAQLTIAIIKERLFKVITAWHRNSLPLHIQHKKVIISYSLCSDHQQCLTLSFDYFSYHFCRSVLWSLAFSRIYYHLRNHEMHKIYEENVLEETRLIDFLPELATELFSSS